MMRYTNIDFNTFVSCFRGLSLFRGQMEGGGGHIDILEHVWQVFVGVRIPIGVIGSKSLRGQLG